MATRNLTKKFEGIRAQCRMSAQARSSEWDTHSGDGRSSLLSEQEDSSGAGAGGAHTLASTLPPQWVDIVDDVHEDFAKLRTAITELQELHSKRLKVTFGEDESRQEAAIDAATGKVTGLIKGAENKIKRIAAIDNDGSQQLTKAERDVRLNVMRNLGTELAGISKSVRATQKEYLGKLNAQKNVGHGQFKDTEPSEGRMDDGMSEEQTMELMDIEAQSLERDKEIIRLVESVNELSSLFQELSVLVIEQGTVLDRIDYNVEQTLVRMQESTQELQKADDYSKKSLALKAIIVLIVVIIIECIVLAIKHR